jgi:hypothetical protein
MEFSKIDNRFFSKNKNFRIRHLKKILLNKKLHNHINKKLSTDRVSNFSVIPFDEIEQIMPNTRSIVFAEIKTNL